MDTIYLDNGASTRVDDEVLKAMLPFFTEIYANASSTHPLGKKAKDAIKRARKTISKEINSKTR